MSIYSSLSIGTHLGVHCLTPFRTLSLGLLSNMSVQASLPHQILFSRIHQFALPMSFMGITSLAFSTQDCFIQIQPGNQDSLLGSMPNTYIGGVGISVLCRYKRL